MRARWRWHRRYSVIVLLMLFGISGWLSRQTVENIGSVPSDDTMQSDYYLRNFKATQVDLHRNGRYILHADEMIHFAGSGLATLDSPHIMIQQEGKSPWYIDANTGVLLESMQRIQLQGAVRVRWSGQSQPRLILLSDDLLIQVAESLAKTDHAVRIEQANGVTDAIGLRLDLNLRRLSLLAQVRSRYVAVSH